MASRNQQQQHYQPSYINSTTNNSNSISGASVGFMGAAQRQQQQHHHSTNIVGCGGAVNISSTAGSSSSKVKPVNSPIVGQTHSVEGGSRAQTVDSQATNYNFENRIHNSNNNNISSNNKNQKIILKTPEYLTSSNQLNEKFEQINLNTTQQRQQNSVATVPQQQQQTYFNNRNNLPINQNFINCNTNTNLTNNNCAIVAGQQQPQHIQNFTNPFQTQVKTSDFNNINTNNNNNNTNPSSVIKTTTLNLPVTSYALSQQPQQQQQQYPVEQIYYTNDNNTLNDNYVYTFNPQDPYDENFDEDMEAERDLAEDAQWKKIQQNTFTRWANEHLKTIDRSINSLESDLSDGLRLIALIEVLSQKRMPKYNKRPTFRSQKLENVSVALKFLEDEGIKIVNIDSSDIVDCKLKLILGLIWTLILHYSISMPMWEGENENQLNGSGPTPKQRLLNWIHGKIPDMPINNFTNDWTSGKAVGALVDACAPGLCPDWEMWDPKDAVQNASEAMGLADDWLNVRQLIKPEELVNPNVDEQSMMTYLSQYPNAKLKQGAPLRPKTNPN
ncbi:Filamin-A, partial [Lucilia cuprina]